MKKKILIIILLLLAISLCCVSSVIIYGISRVGENLSNSLQNEETWEEVKVPYDGFSGEIIFMSQAARPLLAEYNYRLRIKSGDETHEFELPMNTGGQINENIYSISYKGTNYLEVRNTIINLKSLSVTDLSTVETAYPEHQNDLDYYELKIKGNKHPLGNIQSGTNGLIFVEKISDKNDSVYFKNIRWEDWVNLPSQKGKIRFGVDKSDMPMILAYIEISNGKESSIFQVNTSFKSTDIPVKIVEYESFTYLIIYGSSLEAYNVESLTQIENASSSGFSDNFNYESENIWVESLLLQNILKNGVSQEIGRVSFEKDKATFTL